MSSGTTDKSFTQQWLQSLTLAAKEPIAQQIKPLLETINELTRQHGEGDRVASARRLWDFSVNDGLLGMLQLMPLRQPNWVFDRDDQFLYTRRSEGAPSGSTTAGAGLDFDTWLGWLGLQPCEVALTAEVNSRDWQSRLRQEAVRLQQTLNTAAMPSGLTLRLNCHAVWDLQHWSIRFDDAQWMRIPYEDPFSVERPEFSEIEETILWAMAEAHDGLQPKSPCAVQVEPGPWMNCVPRFKELHERVLVKDAKKYSAWFRRVWSCVWTIIYREQNVLRGQANIDTVRQEAAAIIKEAPRMTLWMFVFAKLACECQLGRGLGVSADYLA